MENLRKIIRDIIRESVSEMRPESHLDELSDEEYSLISSEYSNKRIILSHESGIDFTASEQNQKVGYKPKGLWYGFGTSWLDWVRSEMPEWEKDYKSIFLLEINEGSVLKMNNKNELIEFTKKYAPPHNPSDPMSFFNRNMIDWSKVASDYDGIEINPYIQSARMDDFTRWYYSWDVASGCIWKKGAIKSITKI